jgi:hypothetical protein
MAVAYPLLLKSSAIVTSSDVSVLGVPPMMTLPNPHLGE